MSTSKATSKATSFDPEFRCGHTVRGVSASNRQKNWFAPKHGKNGKVRIIMTEPTTPDPEHVRKLVQNAMYNRW